MDEEYSGPERRASDRELREVKLEMAQIRSAMTAAVSDLVTQESLNATAKRSAIRLSGSYVVLAAAIVFVGLYLNSNQNRIEDIARDAKVAATKAQVSADTLNDCLLVGGTCYRRLAEQGTQGSVRQMRFHACVLTILPEERTLERVVRCGEAAYPEIANLGEQLRRDGAR